MSLSAAQVAEFFDVGYIVLPDVFRAGEVAAIGAEFDRLRRLASGLGGTSTIDGSQFVMNGPNIQRVVWCSGAAPGLEAWTPDSRILAPVFQLLTRSGCQPPDHVVQIICQAHFKLPGDGVSFPWHQDAQHRRYGTPEWSDINGLGSYVQTVLAIDRMDADNGPLCFVPGSCKGGPLSPEQVISQAEAHETVALTVGPGSLALFGPYTIHGSEPNHSERPRRAWINGYAYPGANRRSYPGCDLGVARRLAPSE